MTICPQDQAAPPAPGVPTSSAPGGLDGDDGRLDPSAAGHYQRAIDAFGRSDIEQGSAALWRGVREQCHAHPWLEPPGEGRLPRLTLELMDEVQPLARGRARRPTGAQIAAEVRLRLGWWSLVLLVEARQQHADLEEIRRVCARISGALPGILQAEALETKGHSPELTGGLAMEIHRALTAGGVNSGDGLRRWALERLRMRGTNQDLGALYRAGRFDEALALLLQRYARAVEEALEQRWVSARIPSPWLDAASVGPLVLGRIHRQLVARETSGASLRIHVSDLDQRVAQEAHRFLEDLSILARYEMGAPDAADQLCRLLGPSIRAVVARGYRPAEFEVNADLEQVVVDALAAIHESLSAQCMQIQDLRAWCCKIARNKAYDAVRSASRLREQLSLEPTRLPERDTATSTSGTRYLVSGRLRQEHSRQVLEDVDALRARMRPAPPSRQVALRSFREALPDQGERLLPGEDDPWMADSESTSMALDLVSDYRACSGALERKHRLPLNLWLLGYTTAAIAQALRHNVNTVRAWYQRGRAAVLTCLISKGWDALERSGYRSAPSSRPENPEPQEIP